MGALRVEATERLSKEVDESLDALFDLLGGTKTFELVGDLGHDQQVAPEMDLLGDDDVGEDVVSHIQHAWSISLGKVLELVETSSIVHVSFLELSEKKQDDQKKEGKKKRKRKKEKTNRIEPILRAPVSRSTSLRVDPSENHFGLLAPTMM